MPVSPVAFDVAQREGQLIERGLDFLQADDVGTFARDPLEQLRLPGADAVDVPGRDLQSTYVALSLAVQQLVGASMGASVP